MADNHTNSQALQTPNDREPLQDLRGRPGRWATGAVLLAGIVLLIFLIKRYDPGEVLLAIASTGWGALWIAAYRFVPIAVDAAGWRELSPPWARSHFLKLFLFRWIGEAV